MANNPSFTELVTEVANKTAEELIPWEVTTSATIFAAPMGGSYLLRVGESVIKPNRIYHFLQIIDSDGDGVMSTSSNTYPMIDDIYRRAHNQALGIDKAIGSVLEDLRKLKK
jgi:hypothetical protein